MNYIAQPATRYINTSQRNPLHIPTYGLHTAYPAVERVSSPVSKPTKIIEVPDGFITSAEAVYRTRKYALFTVTLMNGRKGQVVSLKPAMGELYRNPKRLIAVIWDEATGHKSEVEIRAWQPMKVS